MNSNEQRIISTYASSSTAAVASRASFETVSTVDDDDTMPWDEDDYWVPRQKNGKQKTPNMIRNELQRYIDACKANGTSTQTAILERMRVNNNSFRRFMNPKTYKDQWSAVQNQTYWAAARLLETVKIEKEKSKQAMKKIGKRKAVDTTDSEKRHKSFRAREEVRGLMVDVNNVDGVSYLNGVYDTCPQVIAKIKAFFERDGVTKGDFVSLGLGGVNLGSLNRFLASKNQDQAGNITYKRAYEFFEKLRIMQNEPKSRARLKNEAEKHNGFSAQPKYGRKPGIYIAKLWP